jgi:carbon-monoxide dehydrogenase large subunit
MAAETVIMKGRRLAAWLLETTEADVEFADGVFRVRGANRHVSFSEVARRSYQGVGLPAELGVGLDGVGTHPGPNTFPNGCMIAEVELDPETGDVWVTSLSAVDDSGVLINPLIVEGQLHGGTAQGLGEALLERVIYDRDTGQLMTGSFMDYAMPRAGHLPNITWEAHSVPAKTNPLGVKGGSEAGNVGAPPAIIHAIIDALSAWGATDIEMPATPERVLRIIWDRESAAPS